MSSALLENWTIEFDKKNPAKIAAARNDGLSLIKPEHAKVVLGGG